MTVNDDQTQAPARPGGHPAGRRGGGPLRAAADQVRSVFGRDSGLPLAASWFLTDTASWIGIFGLPLLVLQRYHAGFAIGVALALRFVPSVVLGPLAGELVDRTRRPRAAAVWATAAIGVLTAAVPLAPALWVLQVLTLLIGVVWTIEAPSRFALRSQAIATNRELEGNALIVFGQRLAQIVGPGLAALIFATAGIGWVFAVAAIALLAGAALLVRDWRGVPAAAPPAAEGEPAHDGAPRPDLTPADRPGLLARVARGVAMPFVDLFVSLRGDHVVSALTLTSFTYVAAVGATRVFLAAYALSDFRHVPGMSGYLLGAMGIGGLVGAPVAARLKGFNQGTVYVAGNVLEGMCWLALPFVGAPAAALAILLLAGIFETVATVVFFAEVQVRLDDRVVGKYYGALVPLTDGSAGVGQGAAAWALAFAGLGAIGTGVFLAMAAPVLVLIRPLVSRHDRASRVAAAEET